MVTKAPLLEAPKNPSPICHHAQPEGWAEEPRGQAGPDWPLETPSHELNQLSRNPHVGTAHLSPEKTLAQARMAGHSQTVPHVLSRSDQPSKGTFPRKMRWAQGPLGSPRICPVCLPHPGLHRRLSKEPWGSTSGVHCGKPPGGAGQDDVTHPRAHGHQKLALKEPSLQGMSPPPLPLPDRPVPQLPYTGPGHTIVIGAGPQG